MGMWNIFISASQSIECAKRESRGWVAGDSECLYRYRNQNPLPGESVGLKCRPILNSPGFSVNYRSSENREKSEYIFPIITFRVTRYTGRKPKMAVVFGQSGTVVIRKFYLGGRPSGLVRKGLNAEKPNCLMIMNEDSDIEQ